MTDPAIRAALEAAERESTTAGKIAAFLRELPEGWEVLEPSRCGQYTMVLQPSDLAAAVEAAAKEPGHE